MKPLIIKITTKIITGVGIGPIYPAPRNCHSLVTTLTGEPPVYTYASPLAIFIVARVTIKAGIVVLAMNKPLNIPISTPTKSPNIKAANNGRLYLETPPAAIQPERAIMEPTERSIPPRIITIVIAHAIYRLVDICLSTLKMFFGVRKVDFVIGFNASIAQRISNAAIIPMLSLNQVITPLCKYVFNFIPLLLLFIHLPVLSYLYYDFTTSILS